MQCSDVSFYQVSNATEQGVIFQRRRVLCQTGEWCWWRGEQASWVSTSSNICRKTTTMSQKYASLTARPTPTTWVSVPSRSVHTSVRAFLVTLQAPSLHIILSLILCYVSKRVLKTDNENSITCISILFVCFDFYVRWYLHLSFIAHWIEGSLYQICGWKFTYNKINNISRDIFFYLFKKGVYFEQSSWAWWCHLERYMPCPHHYSLGDPAAKWQLRNQY